MAGDPGGRKQTPSTEARRSSVDARDELNRTLERDTAVQGERAEDAATATRSPSGAGSAPPIARPAPTRHKKTS